MFWQRSLAALTLGPLTLVLVWRGGWAYVVLASVLIGLAAIEYVSLAQRAGRHISYTVLMAAVVVQIVAAQFDEPGAVVNGPLLLLSLLIVSAYALYRYERVRSTSGAAEWLAMLAGVILVGWLASHLLRLRNLEALAWQWTTIMLVATWAMESGSYVVGKFLAGRILGRHQLSPRLSPKKTVEGYFGGIFFGAAVALPTGLWLLALPLVPLLVVIALITVASPMGDLAISLLKREAGAKDSGRLFPGHGGVLDRMDSIMWSAAFTYYTVLVSGALL